MTKKLEPTLELFMENFWASKPDVTYLAPNKERIQEVYTAVKTIEEIIKKNDKDAKIIVEHDCLTGKALDVTIIFDYGVVSRSDIDKFANAFKLGNGFDVMVHIDESIEEPMTKISTSFEGCYYEVVPIS